MVGDKSSLLKPRILVSLAILTALVGSTAPSPLYGLYQAELGFSSTTLTSLYAVYAIGVLLALGLLGRLSDKLGDRRLIIVPALLIVASGSLVFAFSSGLSGLFWGRFLAGVGTGALTGSANAALVGFDARDGKPQAAVLATVAFTLGAALGPVLSSTAIAFEYYPKATPFVLNATLAALTAVGLCMVTWVGTSSRQTSTAHSVGPRKLSLRQDMSSAWGAFGRISGVLVIAWSVGSVFVALGPSMILSIIENPSSSSHARAGLLVTAFQATAGITQFLFRKVLPTKAMRLGGALMVAAWLGCLVAFYLASPWLFVVFSVLSGVGYGASFVGAMGVFTRLAPPDHRASLGSLFYLAGYLGSAICIIAVGAAVDALGIPLASASMLLVMTSALGLLLMRRSESAR